MAGALRALLYELLWHSAFVLDAELVYVCQAGDVIHFTKGTKLVLSTDGFVKGFYGAVRGPLRV